jgi:hypothetical protein
MNTRILRGVVAAAALAAAGATAHAGIVIDTTLDFDSVPSGTTANDYLTSLGLNGTLHFGNGDVVDDVDAEGLYTGTFHWVDASSVYGPVMVKASDAAISGSNVLANDFEPILVQFAAPVTLNAFSVQLDGNTWGGYFNVLSFLDSSGHAIGGADVSFDTVDEAGFTLSITSPIQGVSGVLLSFGSRDFDNLHISATSAVPEPSSLALALASLGTVALLRRRAR